MSSQQSVVFFRSLSFALSVLLAGNTTSAYEPTRSEAHPNILFITADDLNHDSLGCYGSTIEGITPNLDRLASEGIRVARAYSTVAVCQPVRQTMLTGLYPHHSGSMGFFPIKPNVRTLNQQMRDAGYLMAMFGKNPHYAPRDQFCLDYEETQISRDPSALAQATRKFISSAKQQGRPFLHFVNCTDPHRPFIGTKGPEDLAGGAKPSRVITPEEIKSVPGFLEDLPDVRREIAQYYTSVRRLDDCVGAVLQVLDELGVRDNTLVMFYGGDHGMSFPFAKTNDYEDSSRGALLFRWPGKIRPGSIDDKHLVSTVDFTPTILEAAGVPAIPNMDGRSFWAAMQGQTLDGWNHVYTCYNQNSGGAWLLVRSIRTRDRSYIWNAWSDGKMKYTAENMSGLTWRAMLTAAESDPAIKKRTEFYLYRVPEEFYDLSQDRYERNNLISDPMRKSEIESLQSTLLSILQRIDDPLAYAFAHRNDAQVVSAAKAQIAEEFKAARQAKQNAKQKSKANAKAKSANTTPPKRDSNALSWELPETCLAGEELTVRIPHHLDPAVGKQSLTVTLKSQSARIERKVIQISGEGVAELKFTVPVLQKGREVTLAAFVGTVFSDSQHYLQSKPIPVK